jgi:CheY-like chemotaxis protein
LNGEEDCRSNLSLRSNLILLDIKMPKKTGLEALKGIKSQFELCSRYFQIELSDLFTGRIKLNHVKFRASHNK